MTNIDKILKRNEFVKPKSKLVEYLISLIIRSIIIGLFAYIYFNFNHIIEYIR